MENFVVRIILISLFLIGLGLNAAGHLTSKKKKASRVCRWQGIVYIVITVLCAYVSLTSNAKIWAIIFGILCPICALNSILQLSVAREYKKEFKKCEAEYDAWKAGMRE